MTLQDCSFCGRGTAERLIIGGLIGRVSDVGLGRGLSPASAMRCRFGGGSAIFEPSAAVFAKETEIL